MSNYSASDDSVRVDFFKPSGKWYATEAVKFTGFNDDSIQAAFKNSLRAHLNGRMRGLTAVCLEPCHRTPYPLMVHIPDQGL